MTHEELRKNFQEKLRKKIEEDKNTYIAGPVPRYDNVFFEGMKALEESDSIPEGLYEIMPLVRSDNKYIQVILLTKSKVDIYFLLVEEIEKLYKLEDFLLLHDSSISTTDKFWNLVEINPGYSFEDGFLNHHVPNNIDKIIVVRVK